MRTSLSSCLCLFLLTGCATPLTAVRDFANDTRRLSTSFTPMLDHAVQQCEQAFLDRRVYTTDAPLSRFDPAATLAAARSTCQPIAQENAAALALADTLTEYAAQLAALAADGVAQRADDDLDAVAAQAKRFSALPADQVDAVNGLIRFVGHRVLERSQRDAIIEALNHEQAVGALADALARYAERVYRATLNDRLRDQPLLLEQLRQQKAAPIDARLRMLDIQHEITTLQAQQQTIDALHAAVAQLKISLHALRANIDQLSRPELLAELRKLGKEVNTVRKHLATLSR